MDAKCGRCGASLTSFDGACPSCGANRAKRSASTVVAEEVVIAAEVAGPEAGAPEVSATSPTVATPLPPGGVAVAIVPQSDVLADPLLAGVPLTPEHGKVLGGVQLVRRLGAGGMGAVYAGHHLVLETAVAVKILPVHLTGDESYEERFKREARLSFEIVHANIVRTLHAGKEHGLFFLQMELVQGTSAGELVRAKGRLSEAQAINIALDASRGLAEAHRRGIVHRDVKPDNILVRKEDGRAKIADLGLARVAAAARTSPVITGAGQTLGTPAYMAPEQIEDASHVGPAADIYSVGASLFEMLCGRPPFSTPTLQSLFRDILERPAPDPLVYRPDLSAAVRDVVARCLAKDPAARFATADDLARALEDALSVASRATPPVLPGPPHAPSSAPTAAVPASPQIAPTAAVPAPFTTIDYRTRKRIWALFAAAILGALIFGFVVGTRAPGPPEKKTLLYGILPDRRLTTERLKALEPVTKFLDRDTRRSFEPFVGVTYDDNIEAFVSGKLALGQFGGVTYVLLKERMPEAIPLFQRNVDQRFEAIFIVPASSAIQKIEDLRGVAVEFVDELSTAGYVVPACELLDAGIDPAKDIQVKFAHTHDSVVRDVADGSAAAGVLDARIMESLALDGKVDRRKVRTIHISAPFPDDVWVASPLLDAKVRQKILDAFTGLDATKGDDLMTLNALEAKHYMKAEDSAYDDLRKKIKRLQSLGLLRK